MKCIYRGKRLTRPILFASGFFTMYFGRVPFGIHSDTICKGSIVTPMKGTTFGCLNLFHMTTSLKNGYGADRCSLVDAKTPSMPNANLLKGRVIVQVKPQYLHTDFPATVDALPYISKATAGGRVLANFGEITR